MRIGIDARELCHESTGVGRYLGGLLACWIDDERAREHQFVLYAHAPIPMRLDTRRFATRHVPGTGGTWWEQATLPPVAVSDHLDLWFSPAYTTPLRLPLPTALAVHDLSFVAHPEWFRLREGSRRRFLCRRSVEKARTVITISDFTRRELMERLAVPDAKIHVIPPGVTAPSAARAPARSNDQSARVLFVGSIFNRRHVVDLIRAFEPIARVRPDAALDLVGANRSYPRENIDAVIAREGLHAQVHWHRYVDDARLGELYRGARAFAFLSEYEGLGLTPLEALAHGVPPILLDTPVARESCGDAALYVAPNDLAATTRALEMALFSDETRARLLAAAPAVLARYDWTVAARETLAALLGAASS
jgi:glycosyltransferase involved in cell wall biosynthesis